MSRKKCLTKYYLNGKIRPMKVEEIRSFIHQYYRMRGLKFPDFNQALKFALTELAEALELELSLHGGWVRNNPSGKEHYTDKRMEEELGDVLMMVIVAGMALGLDPITGMISKMERKLSENRPKNNA